MLTKGDSSAGKGLPGCLLLICVNIYRPLDDCCNASTLVILHLPKVSSVSFQCSLLSFPTAVSVNLRHQSVFLKEQCASSHIGSWAPSSTSGVSAGLNEAWDSKQVIRGCWCCWPGNNHFRDRNSQPIGQRRPVKSFGLTLPRQPQVALEIQ